VRGQSLWTGTVAMGHDAADRLETTILVSHGHDSPPERPQMDVDYIACGAQRRAQMAACSQRRGDSWATGQILHRDAQIAEPFRRAGGWRSIRQGGRFASRPVRRPERLIRT